MYYFLIITLIILLILKNVFAIFRIKRAISYLNGYFCLEHNVRVETLPKIVIVLPAFEEAKTIEETVKYFSSWQHAQGEVSVLVVTTEKEDKNRKGISTFRIVREILKKYSNLKLLHYPYVAGNKADQINYAVSNLKNIYSFGKLKDIFLAIYDVDSRPNRDTLKIFFQCLRAYPQANIFQQSAIFFGNYQKYRGNIFTKLFLKAAAVEQTRFTLAHEIPRIRREYKFCTASRGLLNSVTYAHCAGHGLFIRASYLEQIKLPSNYYPEDMFYGFIASSLREPILPLPVLDNSEMPILIRDLFLQRASWFLGPFLGQRYRRYVKSKYSDVYKKNRLRIWAISIYATYLGVKWLLTSFVGLLLIVLFLFYDDIVVRSLALTFFATYTLSYYFILSHYSILWGIAGVVKNRPRLTHRLLVSFFGIFYLLFHSIPACYALFGIIISKINFVNRMPRNNVN